jgi:flagellar biosynthesis protein FlhG
MKGLYAEDSLATYALLNEEERKARLERIEEAYRRVTEARTASKGLPPSMETGSPNPEAISGDLPLADLETSPGFFLRQVRQQAGIPLREIADKMKIGVRKLEYIESERFEHLPAPVFLRGFVMQFAAAVYLPNPEEIGRIYLERFKEAARGN